MTTLSRADAIMAMINAKLVKQAARLNADGDLHSLHLHVVFNERTGRPSRVRINMEVEEVLER